MVDLLRLFSVLQWQIQGGGPSPLEMLNPMQSGGGGFKSPPPPPIFCPHAFNFGATLLCVGDFSQKIV